MTRALNNRSLMMFIMLALGASAAMANGPKTTKMLIEPGGAPAYFSPRLGAQFTIQRISMGSQSFWAARIVSEPVYGSPLNQLGLGIGDIVTRLDGVRVTRLGELERHILQTKVRFIRAGSYYVENGWIMINPHRYFQNSFYPPNPWGGSGWPMQP